LSVTFRLYVDRCVQGRLSYSLGGAFLKDDISDQHHNVYQDLPSAGV
jgi:hypothetical protein